MSNTGVHNYWYEAVVYHAKQDRFNQRFGCLWAQSPLGALERLQNSVTDQWKCLATRLQIKHVGQGGSGPVLAEFVDAFLNKKYEGTKPSVTKGTHEVSPSKSLVVLPAQKEEKELGMVVWCTPYTKVNFNSSKELFT